MSINFSDRDFQRLSALVYAKSGIHLHEKKKELMRSRLGKRLRATGSRNFEEYYGYLIQYDDGRELVQMLDAITTNKTSFFREPSHFTFLHDNVFPVYQRSRRRPVKLRLWSAGCSSGEEPYSMAISILEYFRKPFPLDCRILATDISTAILERAREGIYQENKLGALPITVMRRYFKRGYGKREGFYQVKENLREMVTFGHLNLMESFEFKHPFDAIFCRNTMIYFDKDTQARLVKRFHHCLAPGGYLFIGHSESLAGLEQPFAYVQPSIYRKA
ncbi:MAG: CheR family methyltransferase [Desulfatibacillaceae bacterium]